MSLANSDVIAMVAVKDTKAGKEFYGCIRLIDK